MPVSHVCRDANKQAEFLVISEKKNATYRATQRWVQSHPRCVVKKEPEPIGWATILHPAPPLAVVGG